MQNTEQTWHGKTANKLTALLRVTAKIAGESGKATYRCTMSESGSEDVLDKQRTAANAHQQQASVLRGSMSRSWSAMAKMSAVRAMKDP